ncbi:MAG: phage major capsid protein [Phycisphaerae bacterium]|nr:phage major capsid protein [Phycisphaerae bacterium]
MEQAWKTERAAAYTGGPPPLNAGMPGVTFNKDVMMGFTDNDIKNAFKEAGVRMDEQAESVEEVRAHCKQLASMVRQTAQWARDGVDAKGGEYNRFWPSDDMAESFGVLVAKCLGKNYETRNKAMETGVGSDGGFLVPETLSAWIIQKLATYGVFRRNTQVVPCGARQFAPKMGDDVVVYCPGESKAITASDLKVAMVKLEPRKFCALTVLSRELDEDSLVGMAELVGISMTRALAKKEDEIAFLGNGAAEHFGMVGIEGAFRAIDSDPDNVAGLQVQEIPGAWSAFTLGDFESLIARLDPAADTGAKWYTSRMFFFQVMHALARSAGAADMFQILSAQTSRHFMGREVEFVSCMPRTAADNQIVAILGDLRLGSFLGQRGVLEIARSDHAFFTTDQIGVRATERVDINAFGVGSADTAESIVALVTDAE